MKDLSPLRDILAIFFVIDVLVLIIENRSDNDELYYYPGVLLLALGAFCLLYFILVIYKSYRGEDSSLK